MQVASQTLPENIRGQTTLDIHKQAVERVIQVMHSHIDEALTLEDLASVAYLSPYHFNRVFRHLIGIPPGEFLAALRLHVAQRLLLTTSLSVTDVCFEVGYTSTSSFTTRFTRLVGLAPRLLRQQAHKFELPVEVADPVSTMFRQTPLSNMLQGKISAPANFRGTIYIGLFRKPLPQGKPVSCVRLSAPGFYLLNGIPNGVYYLLTAAFPLVENQQAYLWPGENILLGANGEPLVIRDGHISGNPDLTLRPPLLTDPPMVMALPFLEVETV